MDMNNDPIIQVDGVSKVYHLYERPRDRLKEALLPGKRRFHRDFYAIKDVSFELPRGEAFGIVGRNGSGKSTLLKMLAGVLTPTTGRIRVTGRVASLLELGAGFNLELSGIDNIYLQGTIMGLSRREMGSRVERIIAFADIGDFIAQPVKHYSSGMFVRLAFACAIHVEPDILIVDEALAVGDLEFQQKSYHAICRLKEQGASILLVSHDLGAIVEFCSRAMLLDHGVNLASGAPIDVVNKFKQLLSTSSVCSASAFATPLLPVGPQETLKSHFKPERSLNEYGGEVATIRDWGVRNSRGQATSIIDNSEDMEVVIELEFHKPCGRPIVGYFLTDAKGREIVGTNTAFEGVRVGERMPGDVLRIRFRQKMAIAPGGYFLNLGCSEDTGGEIVAHHRLYNLTTLTILSNKRFVGFCSLNPQIVVDYPNRITP